MSEAYNSGTPYPACMNSIEFPTGAELRERLSIQVSAMTPAYAEVFLDAIEKRVASVFLRLVCTCGVVAVLYQAMEIAVDVFLAIDSLQAGEARRQMDSVLEECAISIVGDSMARSSVRRALSRLRAA